MNGRAQAFDNEDLQRYPSDSSEEHRVTVAMTESSLVQPSNPQCRLGGMSGHGQGCECAAASNPEHNNSYGDLGLEQLHVGAEGPSSYLSPSNGAASWWTQRQSLTGYPQSHLTSFSTSDDLTPHSLGSQTVAGSQVQAAAGSDLTSHSSSSFPTPFGPHQSSFNFGDQYSYPSNLTMGEATVGNSVRDVKSVKPRQSPESDRSASDETTSPSSPHATVHSSRAEYGPHRGTTEKQMHFLELKTVHNLKCNDHVIKPDIDARMDKNLMWVDGQWTCYRRNYITIGVHYRLNPNLPGVPVKVDMEDGSDPQVKQFGVSLTATIDEDSGKSIGLIQHTAKRDRGPQTDVGVVRLPPLAPGSNAPPWHGTNETTGPWLPFQDDKETKSSGITQQANHTFERIQFKQATQNNGRRRAQQQFYHIMIELHADIRERYEDPEHWIKVAYKMSDAMVVRGRSPGHYKDSPSSSGQSSGSSGGNGNGYSLYHPHSGFRAYNNLPSHNRSSMGGGGGGGYRSNHCLSGGHTSLVSTPAQSFTSPMRKHHDPPTLPFLVEPGSYTSLSNSHDDGYRSYWSPVIYNDLRPHSQSLVKPEVPQSPHIFSGSCGSEEPTLNQIYSPYWTINTCSRIPLDSRSSYVSDIGATY